MCAAQGQGAAHGVGEQTPGRHGRWLDGFVDRGASSLLIAIDGHVQRIAPRASIAGADGQAELNDVFVRGSGLDSKAQGSGVGCGLAAGDVAQGRRVGQDGADVGIAGIQSRLDVVGRIGAIVA